MAPYSSESNRSKSDLVECLLRNRRSSTDSCVRMGGRLSSAQDFRGDVRTKLQSWSWQGNTPWTHRPWTKQQLLNAQFLNDRGGQSSLSVVSLGLALAEWFCIADHQMILCICIIFQDVWSRDADLDIQCQSCDGASGRMRTLRGRQSNTGSTRLFVAIF